MAKINIKKLSGAIKKADGMNLKQKEEVFDEIFKEQPNLLASVLVQKNMGNSLEDIDVLLNILLVLHLTLGEAGIKIETISEEELERQLQLLVSQVKFTEGMGGEYVYESINQYIKNSGEEYLLAFALREMMNANILSNKNETSKYLVIAGLNMVNCIVNAKQKAGFNGHG